MKTLKNSLLLFLLSSLISACQFTRVFRIETFPDPKGDLHIIQVNSNRVQQKCLFFDAEAENKWRHQYLMYILGEKKEAFEIMQSTNQDKDTCEAQVKAIEKILKAESQVKICVRDQLRRSPVPDDQKELISFGLLGRHKVTQEGLTFDTICNSKKCVGDNGAWVDTCPGFVKH